MISLPIRTKANAAKYKILEDKLELYIWHYNLAPCNKVKRITNGRQVLKAWLSNLSNLQIMYLEYLSFDEGYDYRTLTNIRKGSNTLKRVWKEGIIKGYSHSLVYNLPDRISTVLLKNAHPIK